MVPFTGLPMIRGWMLDRDEITSSSSEAIICGASGRDVDERTEHRSESLQPCIGTGPKTTALQPRVNAAF